MSYFEGGAYSEKEKMMLFVGIAVAAILIWCSCFKESFGLFDNKEKATVLGQNISEQQYGLPQAQWLGANRLGQVATGANFRDGNVHRDLLRPGEVDAAWTRLQYPPPNTTYKPSTTGAGNCAVSGTNNCPPDLYWKCDQDKWSKDAIGEALALVNVGAYATTSHNLQFDNIINQAADKIGSGCQNAANIQPYNPNSRPG